MVWKRAVLDGPLGSEVLTVVGEGDADAIVGTQAHVGPLSDVEVDLVEGSVVMELVLGDEDLVGVDARVEVGACGGRMDDTVGPHSEGAMGCGAGHA